MEIPIIEFLIKVGAGAVAGMCMGIERQIKGKPAGLKTNALVGLASTVFVLVSLLFQGENSTDMTRIIGQIVVGVGFLGAAGISLIFGYFAKRVEPSTLEVIKTSERPANTS